MDGPYTYNASDKDAPCWIIENGDEVQVLAVLARTRSVRHITLVTLLSIYSHGTRY